MYSLAKKIRYRADKTNKYFLHLREIIIIITMPVAIASVHCATFVDTVSKEMPVSKTKPPTKGIKRA